MVSPASRSDIVASAMAAIDVIDLAEICRKLDQLGWNDEDVQATERRYRRFLCMRYIGVDFHLVPAKDIDEMWHQHILHTRKYAQDCERVFGRFVHHSPGIDDSAEMVDHVRANFRKTEALYKELFGEDYVGGWLSYFL